MRILFDSQFCVTPHPNIHDHWLPRRGFELRFNLEHFVRNWMRTWNFYSILTQTIISVSILEAEINSLGHFSASKEAGSRDGICFHDYSLGQKFPTLRSRYRLFSQVQRTMTSPENRIMPQNRCKTNDVNKIAYPITFTVHNIPETRHRYYTYSLRNMFQVCGQFLDSLFEGDNDSPRRWTSYPYPLIYEL